MAVPPAKRKLINSGFVELPPKQYFEDIGIGKVIFDSGISPQDTLKFKYYQADKIVMGRRMKEWLRFSVAFWHSFSGSGADPFGQPTIQRPWHDPSGTEMENAKRRLRVAFAFLQILGLEYFTFHDRDISPEGDSIDVTNRNLDEITDLLVELQKETGIKVLWVTCNFFSHPRYMNGAATNPDLQTVMYAGWQLKKGLEIAKKVNAENFIFWGGREGYQSLLNTDLALELSHLAGFLRMAVDYKLKINFAGQFCIEPKAKEPTKHQYDFDAATTIGFLERHRLKDHFKLNIEPNHTRLAGHDILHDVQLASALGMLGSVDANRGAPDAGWDTDQFPMNPTDCALLMKIVVEQGGLSPGGLNFDCKLRRESTELRDLFVAHIGAMDALARGLLAAVRMVEEGILAKMLKERYLSFESELGRRFESGTMALEECEEHIKKEGHPRQISGRQEHFEAVLNSYIHMYSWAAV